MKTLFRLLVFVSVFAPPALGQDINKLLFELPDVIFEEQESRFDSVKIFKLQVKQPLDHRDLSKGFFYQKVYLTHVGFGNPNVIVTEGYSIGRNRTYELTRLLKANQIQVEHRYFGESMPDKLDYEFLNMEQATADLHKVNQLMRKIYSGKWVSTGISKGGATSIFYRYFFPDDVDASVPYVAPINEAFEENRIYTFLDNVGTPECRQKIKSFQIRMLENHYKIMPLLDFYSLGAKLDFTYLSMEEAFEFTVLEYPFAFWQWGHACDEIPSDTVSLHEALKYLLDVSELGFFGDASMKKYASHYYQSATEMGYYGYETEEFKDLLKALPAGANPHAAFVPGKMDFEFDGTLLDKVNKWLKIHGNQFIYIYGELDTWSASAVPPSKTVDAVWFFMKGQHHGSARIRNLSEEERSKLVDNLERWLSIEIN